MRQSAGARSPAAPLQQPPRPLDFGITALPQLQVQPIPDLAIDLLLDHGGRQHVGLPTSARLGNPARAVPGARGKISVMTVAPPSAEPAREVLAGFVERVTFHNEENGFCVLRVKARGHRDLVTLIGHAATIAAGEAITASGTWANDRTHGLQFKAHFLKASAPTTVEGIRRYLASGMIRGIGPVYAKKLVRGFGEAVFEVIENAPERLREVKGIGAVRAQRIVAAWAEQKMVREIMVFLHSHGVGTARAVRIFKTYGADAIQVMSENPYRLARDIRGIGFKTADAIADRLGIGKTALIRVRAGIGYALSAVMDEGHCGLPVAELLPLAERLLGVPDDLLRTALDLELAGGGVIEDRVGERDCVFLAGLYNAERGIAERLRALMVAPLPWPPIDAGKAIPWAEQRIGLILAESQREAAARALKSKLLVITGGPGVGKTTILRAILQILAAKKVHILLAAPTGRAAKRLSEATGLEANMPRRFGLDPVRDIQVLCPMARGGVGARSLNIDLQAALNPDGAPKVTKFGWTFAPGDKVCRSRTTTSARSTTATSASSPLSMPKPAR
jgi:exodeoxyribonuclease V alpha subunit